MLEKMKQKTKKYINPTNVQLVCMCAWLGLSVYAPETFAGTTWGAAIKLKLLALKEDGVMYGGIICALSIVGAVINAFWFDIDWKWFRNIFIGGAVIAGVSEIVTWLGLSAK